MKVPVNIDILLLQDFEGLFPITKIVSKEEAANILVLSPEEHNDQVMNTGLRYVIDFVARHYDCPDFRS